MKKYNISLSLFYFVVLVFGFLASLQAAEDVNITTYFPSPQGFYFTIIWGDIVSDNSRGILSGDQGSSIELGGVGTLNTPYIDFHNDMSIIDYDGRIILYGDDALVFQKIPPSPLRLGIGRTCGSYARNSGAGTWQAILDVDGPGAGDDGEIAVDDVWVKQKIDGVAGGYRARWLSEADVFVLL